MERFRGVALDTDIIIDFLRGKERAVRLIKKLYESNINLATTVINIFELSWGAYKLGKKRVNDIEKLTESLIILNMTVKDAIKAGEEIAYLESLGLKIDIRDLLIGIITRENGYTLLTGNVKHFNRIKDLDILQYE